MAELWSGHAPANHCPKIDAPKVETDQLSPGQTVRATVKLSDPDGDPLAVKWVLSGEVTRRSEGGAHEDGAAQYPESIVSSSEREAQIKMPQQPGTYRLFIYARDGHGNGAVANTALRVTESK
jgi:hypothetical protein